MEPFGGLIQLTIDRLVRSQALRSGEPEAADLLNGKDLGKLRARWPEGFAFLAGGEGSLLSMPLSARENICRLITDWIDYDGYAEPLLLSIRRQRPAGSVILACELPHCALPR